MNGIEPWISRIAQIKSARWLVLRFRKTVDNPVLVVIESSAIKPACSFP
jgi:hypothetical protein